MDGTGGGTGGILPVPGRLAGLRRRFESAFRQPGLDPATFATDLEMLAIQGFGDMKEQAQDTMIRDKFIAGQGQCALRRQLDGFAQGTPIGEIVDSYARVIPTRTGFLRGTMIQRLGASRVTLGLGNEGKWEWLLKNGNRRPDARRIGVH